MNHKWTPEADARLAELYPKQKTADIAHACRRVDEAARQPDLFIAPKPDAPKQESLL